MAAVFIHLFGGSVPIGAVGVAVFTSENGRVYTAIEIAAAALTHRVVADFSIGTGVTISTYVMGHFERLSAFIGTQVTIKTHDPFGGIAVGQRGAFDIGPGVVAAASAGIRRCA